MVTPQPRKAFEEVLYYSRRISEGGHQPVYRKSIPDGDIVELKPKASQRLHNHSPDGFQWGYLGSGCAQLALALLLDATGVTKKAKNHYQHFKLDFVAKWDKAWYIYKSQIVAWVELQELLESYEGVGKI